MVYKNNGYIYGVSDKPIDKESIKIYEVIKSKPTPPNGYDYRLKEDLTWELFELPQSTETPTENEATEADYISALEDLGVKFGG